MDLSQELDISGKCVDDISLSNLLHRQLAHIFSNPFTSSIIEEASISKIKALYASSI